MGGARDTPLTLADERIARAIPENNARLVIIDPVQAFLGADVDMNRANEVRPIFRSLGDIAQATLVYLHIHPDGGDLQRGQVAAGIVEVVCNGSIADVLARTALISCVDHRIVDAPCLGHQPAAIQSAGDKIGRQRVAAAGEVTGRCAKSRRDQGGVLTPVYIGIFPFVDGVIAGRSAE